VTSDEYRFPEHDYPSDFEMWLEPDVVIRLRGGVRITELAAQEARDLGLALVELADLVDDTEAWYAPRRCRFSAAAPQARQRADYRCRFSMFSRWPDLARCQSLLRTSLCQLNIRP
jgi:hypothetical protein